MKKVLFLFTILIVFLTTVNAWAISPVILDAIAQGGCDACSATGVLFSWHMEDTDVTLESPCGCSMGDTTATPTNSPAISSAQAHDGSNSVHINAQEDYRFTVSGEDIFHEAEGKVIVWVYLVTIVDAARIWHMYGDSNDEVYLYMNDTGQLRVGWVGNGTPAIVNLNTAMQTNGWNRITYQYDQSKSNADHKLCLDNTGDGIDDACSSAEDDLTDFDAAIAQVIIGNSTATSPEYYIDTITIEYESGL